MMKHRSVKGNGLLIHGQRIYLRKVNIRDANKSYLSWMKDNEINRFLESRFERWSIKKLKEYVREISKDPRFLFLAIILKDSDRHIGNVKIGPINKVHSFADIGIIIGEKSFWGQGIATEAIRLVTGYAFRKLRLHKLTASAYSNNTGSIKVFKNSGFKVEGERQGQFFCKGTYVGQVMLGIINR